MKSGIEHESKYVFHSASFENPIFGTCRTFHVIAALVSLGQSKLHTHAIAMFRPL